MLQYDSQIERGQGWESAMYRVCHYTNVKYVLWIGEAEIGMTPLKCVCVKKEIKWVDGMGNEEVLTTVKYKTF